MYVLILVLAQRFHTEHNVSGKGIDDLATFPRGAISCFIKGSKNSTNLSEELAWIVST